PVAGLERMPLAGLRRSCPCQTPPAVHHESRGTDMPSKKPRLAPPPLQPPEPRLPPSASSPRLETVGTTPVGTLPARWAQSSGDGSAAFAVSGGRSLSPAHGLALSAGASTLVARTWLDAAAAADVQVGAAVYLDTLIPAQLIARGSGLNTAAPSYYSL